MCFRQGVESFARSVRSMVWILVYGVGMSLVLTPDVARATDGVIELNNVQATAGSATPGDAPGYPVTISKAGSYKLTGDLFVSGTNSNVIEVGANDVAIDLNGFTIRCLYFGTPCAGNGTGIGISAGTRTNVSVRNGTIRDMGAAAVEVGPNGLVENIQAIANGSGITVTEGVVRNCLASENVGDGIFATDTIVRDSSSRENAVGIHCGSGTPTACVLLGNDLTKNSVGALDGFSESLGHNRRCNVLGVSCTLF